ncbi:MAG: LysR substrate-binding domain-containing protein [Parvibaculum sp.]|uniref:LysR family transcriptional regulator n=1 Tax=Parvibaculum sp. TaxID=2024848 RepID=UPI003C7954FA
MAAVFDWNDIRHFLAVARSGTTLAASRDLRVSQSTVARRIVALEEALELELFDKRPSGYVLTDQGEALRAAAERAEAAMDVFAAEAGSSKRGLSGTVRLTTNETFANTFLVRAMHEFRAAYPGVRLEIITSDRLLDLGRGEADVAVRAGARPSEAELVGKRIANDVWSIYCSRDYAEQHGAPANAADLAGHSFVSVAPAPFSGPIIDWVDAHVREETIILRQNSISGLYTSIKAGIGVSMMSDFIAADDPDLVRCFTPDIQTTAEVWLVAHERLRHVPRVRAVLDFLGGYFAAGLHRKGGRPL